MGGMQRAAFAMPQGKKFSDQSIDIPDKFNDANNYINRMDSQEKTNHLIAFMGKYLIS